MSEDVHTYEGAVWEADDGWHAKVLRNGVFFDFRNSFEGRDEALAWARERAEADRAYVAAERKAERVEL